MPPAHQHPVNAEAVAIARAEVLSVADAGRLAGTLLLRGGGEGLIVEA